MYWSSCTSFPPKLKEHDWKIRSTKVDAGNLKHELLNRLWSILAVNVLNTQPNRIMVNTVGYHVLGVHKIAVARSPTSLNFVQWACRMDHASCHSCTAWNFELAVKYFHYTCTTFMLWYVEWGNVSWTEFGFVNVLLKVLGIIGLHNFF
jgi:hypothetical protein